MNQEHHDHERLALALDGLSRAARTTPVRGAPRLGALARRARQRRRRRQVGAVLATVAILVPVGLGVRSVVDEGQERSERITTDPRATEPEMVTTTDPMVLLAPVEEVNVETDVLPLAPGPLSAREAMASVWTGTELLVWGGGAGGQVDGRTFADGAAYAPATDTWRTLAPSPLSPRARATAVWTGTEMVVWSGSNSAHGAGDLLDGAAYDPTTNTWRSIADAPDPSGDRSFPSAAWVDGWMVVGGGTPTSHQSGTILVYDAATDSWSKVEMDGSVVQIVAAGDRAAILRRPPLGPNGVLDLFWLDPDTGAVTAGPELDVGLHIEPGLYLEHIGAAWTGEELVALARGTDNEGHPGGTVASVAPGEPAWHDRRPVPDIDLTWPLAVGFMGEPALLAWTGTDVVAFARDPSRYDPATGRAVAASLTLNTLGEVGCGYDAAQAWTGTEVIWWGGQSCRGDGADLQVATGARLVLPAP